MFISNEQVANRILLGLAADVLKELRPHLHLAELRKGVTISRKGEPINTHYFINRGIVSLIKRMEDGRAVEIGTRGIEGLTTPELLLGVKTPLYEAVVHVPGTAFAISRTRLKDHFQKTHRLSTAVLAYVQAAASQIAQTAACNRLHQLEQRCCRWLLVAHDSARSDRFPLTHEFLAMMLGVQRPRISVALKKLQAAGVLDYSRGQLTIIDRTGLERQSCECYRTTADEFDKIFERRRHNA